LNRYRSAPLNTTGFPTANDAALGCDGRGVDGGPYVGGVGGGPYVAPLRPRELSRYVRPRWFSQLGPATGVTTGSGVFASGAPCSFEEPPTTTVSVVPTINPAISTNQSLRMRGLLPHATFDLESVPICPHGSLFKSVSVATTASMRTMMYTLSDVRAMPVPISSRAELPQNPVVSIAANLPMPWIGVWERINPGVFLPWVMVLAIALLRVEHTARGIVRGTANFSTHAHQRH
jgi:hypothetical protein